MFLTQCRRNSRGFLTAEILIVIAVITISFVAIFGLFAFALSTSAFIENAVGAANIAQEQIEAVRNLRDGTQWDVDGLALLTSGADYYPEKYGSPAKWRMAPGQTNSGIFTRKVVFNDVLRDLSDNIVQSGGSLDPDTKKITSTVSWIEKGKAYKVETAAFITNWR